MSFPRRLDEALSQTPSERERNGWDVVDELVDVDIHSMLAQTGEDPEEDEFGEHFDLRPGHLHPFSREDPIKEPAWFFDNAFFVLSAQILHKDEQYRLFLSREANMREDIFAELASKPRFKFDDLKKNLDPAKFVNIFGIEGYGDGLDEKAIAQELGTRVVNVFERSNSHAD